MAYINYTIIGEFEKAEYISGISKFTRDSSVKYSETSSYKIESPELNDAVFYKEVNVKKNTPYRVSCMVKAENIELEKENSDAGVAICIMDSTDISEPVTDAKEWTKLEFLFNSKNNETIKIGFRLGGNSGLASRNCMVFGF